MDELKAECLVQLLSMSNASIFAIIEGMIVKQVYQINITNYA